MSGNDKILLFMIVLFIGGIVAGIVYCIKVKDVSGINKADDLKDNKNDNNSKENKLKNNVTSYKTSVEKSLIKSYSSANYKDLFELLESDKEIVLSCFAPLVKFAKEIWHLSMKEIIDELLGAYKIFWKNKVNVLNLEYNIFEEAKKYYFRNMLSNKLDSITCDYFIGYSSKERQMIELATKELLIVDESCMPFVDKLLHNDILCKHSIKNFLIKITFLKLFTYMEEIKYIENHNDLNLIFSNAILEDLNQSSRNEVYKAVLSITKYNSIVYNEIRFKELYYIFAVTRGNCKSIVNFLDLDINFDEIDKMLAVDELVNNKKYKTYGMNFVINTLLLEKAYAQTSLEKFLEQLCAIEDRFNVISEQLLQYDYIKTMKEIIDIYNTIKNNKTIVKYVNNFLKKNKYIEYDVCFSLPYIDNDNTITLFDYKDNNFYYNYILENVVKSEIIDIKTIDYTPIKNNIIHYWLYDNYINVNSFDYEDDEADEYYGKINCLDMQIVADVNDLYNALKSQDIIKGGKYYKEAFYLLVGELNIQHYVELYNDSLEKYDIEESISKKELATKLLSKNVAEIEIKNMLFGKMFADKEYVDLVELDDIVEQAKTNKKYNKILADLEDDSDEEKLTIEDIDLMSGVEFENFVSTLFTNMGYKTNTTKVSGDQGVDVVATKGNISVAIQAKCYTGTVGNKAIQEIVAGMKYYKLDKGMVVTNSTFTKSAKELAKANNIVLWDRATLKEKIKDYM